MINSEKLYRRIVETAREGIWIIDKDARTLFVNQSLADMLGYTIEEMIGRASFEFVFDEDTKLAKDLFEKRKAGDTSPRDVRCRRKDGGVMWASVTSSRLSEDDDTMDGLIGKLTDITERKLAEEALRQSEERFAKAFEASPIALTITSLKTGRLIEVNETFVRLSGYTREEAVGHTTLELGLWSNSADREEELGMVAERGQVRNIEYRFRMKDGTELLGLLSAERLDIGGEPCALTVIEDITERKRAEAERADLLKREREARQVAEAASKMKDEFLATLSHELRTPLNAIIGWSDMLCRNQVESSLIGHAVEVINRNAKSQAQLIEDLLDVSRIITGKLQLELRPVNLLSVISAAADIMRPVAEGKGIRLDTRFVTSVGKVSGDPTRLQQVMWNLLSNSIKFTPRGGKIEIKVVEVDSMVEVTVSDTGQGIKPDFLPYIFDRFSQGDSSRTRTHSGLGLGLAIVQSLVNLHGGAARAFSEGEGRGATFTVNLPLAARPQPWRFEQKHSSAEANTGGGHALARLRILLVDDHADTREMLAVMLAAEGAEVRTSGAAREGFEALKQWRADVLVSDIGMPGEDGYWLINNVRRLEAAEGGNVPALALTGYASAEESERALGAGYHKHLAKPMDPDRLIDAIAELAGRGGKSQDV